MCYVYILTDNKNGHYYIGSTNNLNRRIQQHIKGYTKTTYRLKLTRLIYYEEFDNIYFARQREKKLKSYKSKKYLEWLISRAASSTGRATPS